MNNKKTLWIIGVIIILILIVVSYQHSNQKVSAYTIGWISDRTGSTAKYGAYEAGKLAMDEINGSGGINGVPLNIIFEDGKCNGPAAVSAANKLIDIDHVKVILGGHCTPESAAIAPIAEKNKVVMLASITSSPVLSNKGEYVFRTTQVSTTQMDQLTTYIRSTLNLKNVGVIFEQTDYALPLAEKFKESFESKGGNTPFYEAYSPTENDFRSIIAKAKDSGLDGIFLAPQRPDAGLNIIKQIREQDLKMGVFGSDTVGNQTTIDQDPSDYEGVIVSLPNYDPINNPKTKAFADNFEKTYNKPVPYGVYTAESYDAVYIIADAIKKYGLDADKIKDYLSNLTNYEGVSGPITINKDHDGVRAYSLQVIRNGKIVHLQ